MKNFLLLLSVAVCVNISLSQNFCFEQDRSRKECIRSAWKDGDMDRDGDREGRREEFRLKIKDFQDCLQEQGCELPPMPDPVQMRESAQCALQVLRDNCGAAPDLPDPRERGPPPRFLFHMMRGGRRDGRMGSMMESCPGAQICMDIIRPGGAMGEERGGMRGRGRWGRGGMGGRGRGRGWGGRNSTGGMGNMGGDGMGFRGGRRGFSGGFEGMDADKIAQKMEKMQRILECMQQFPIDEECEAQKEELCSCAEQLDEVATARISNCVQGVFPEGRELMGGPPKSPLRHIMRRVCGRRGGGHRFGRRGGGGSRRGGPFSGGDRGSWRRGQGGPSTGGQGGSWRGGQGGSGAEGQGGMWRGGQSGSWRGGQSGSGTQGQGGSWRRGTGGGFAESRWS